MGDQDRSALVLAVQNPALMQLKEPLLSSNGEVMEENLTTGSDKEDAKVDKRAEIFSLVRKVAGETIASFIVVFTLCAAKVNTSSTTGVIPSLTCSLIGGLIVMVTIFSLGHVSGSHINPAVTIAYTIIRHFPLPLAPMYISAQVVGATLAASLIELIYKPESGVLLVTPKGTVVQSLLAETLAGFFLLFVASSVSTDIRAIGEFAGLAVGAIIAVDILIVGPVSGGGINPARALGPAIVSGDFENVWIYVVGPITGGLLGALLYSLLRPEEVRKVNKAMIGARKLSLRRTS